MAETSLHSTVAHANPHRATTNPTTNPWSAPRAGRAVAIGVRDMLHDLTTMEWAIADSAVGVDSLHVIHAYEPVGLDDCGWEPVARARDARYLAARSVITHCLDRVTGGRTDLLCGGSAIRGRPAEVLTELSRIVDLLVIGDDSDRSSPLSRGIQDAASCPVVCVPMSGTLGEISLPVTVITPDDSTEVPEHVIAFASAASERHHVPMRVVRVPEDDASLDRVRIDSSLVVVDATSVRLLRATPVEFPHPCPTAVVR